MYAPSSSGQPQLVRELPADIGKNPGDKMRENDHRTPEGIYFFQKRLAPPEIPFDLYGRLAVTLDYPNAFDRLAGKTGYGIWLHAVPDTVPLTRGSRGCVVISNQVIDEVAAQIHLGKSAMVIDSAVTQLNMENWAKSQKESLDWLESWRQAWEAQRLEDYFAYYHESFTGNGQMNKSAWIRHKTKISKRYQNIQIRVEPRLILQFRNQWVIRLFQHYRSDQHEDQGEKVLYVLASSNGVRQILKEDWVQEIPETSASQTLTNSVAPDSLSQ